MSIQSNINQGLGVAGLLLSQTPAAEKQKEKAQLQSKEKALTRQWHESIEGREKELNDILTNPSLSNKERKVAEEYYTGPFTEQFLSVGERLGDIRTQLGKEYPDKGLKRALRKYYELQTEPWKAELQRNRAKLLKQNMKKEKEINKGFMGARLDPEMDVRGGETWHK